MYSLKLENAQMVSFSTGNPNLAPILHGTISLFKKRSDLDSLSYCEGTLLPKVRGAMVLLPMIPTFVTIQDFMIFLECFMENIKWIKLLRDEHPKRYMALILFKQRNLADTFFFEFQGRKYSSLNDEYEICNVCFVDEVRVHHNEGFWEIMKVDTNSDEIREWREEEGSTENKINNLLLYDDQDVQLPSCPVCLEILDPEISGIITTYCAHNFHIKCLERWGDACPVCRYSGDEAEASCKTCGSINNLWLCLTCGNVGCGRYEQGHAHDHFMKTGHSFAIDIRKKTVWDYNGDQYIHRLIESRLEKELASDGFSKYVDNDIMEAKLNSKLDAIALEYSQLLNQNLTKQRVYFESRLRDLEHEKDQKIREKEDHILILKQKLKQPPEITKNQESRINELERKNEFLKQMNEQLTANQKMFNEEKKKLEEKYKNEIAKIKIELQESQEFNKQLILHLETQASVGVSENKEDIQNGQLLIMKTNQKKKKSRR